MSKKLEQQLKRQARKKGVRDEDAYVYGTLRKIGSGKARGSRGTRKPRMRRA